MFFSAKSLELFTFSGYLTAILFPLLGRLHAFLNCFTDGNMFLVSLFCNEYPDIKSIVRLQHTWHIEQ